MSKVFKNFSSEANELEKSYSLPEIVRQRKHTLNKLSVKPGEQILDVGCGVGFLSYEIALQTGNYGKVCGIDKNLDMIRHANKRCKKLVNTKFAQANANDLPFRENYFDAACCTQVLLYVKNIPRSTFRNQKDSSKFGKDNYRRNRLAWCCN